jgi:hypothetical protein
MTNALGVLVLLGCLGAAGLGLLLVLVGRLQGQRFLPHLGGLLAGGAVGGYVVVWLLALLAAPSRVLSRGQEVSFCGLDCHLHVSVTGADPDGRVRLRFRSDARRALEYPSLLRIEAVGPDGRRYPPVAGLLGAPLGPGDTIEREFRFGLPAGVVPAGVVVGTDRWLDYLLPGRGNPMVQRRLVLSLEG